jgi:hypothetical protein
VQLTDQGQQVYLSLRSVQDPWAIALTDEVPVEDIETTLHYLQRLIHRMEKP